MKGGLRVAQFGELEAAIMDEALATNENRTAALARLIGRLGYAEAAELRQALGKRSTR